jgi:hypothetical protein
VIGILAVAVASFVAGALIRRSVPVAPRSTPPASEQEPVVAAPPTPAPTPAATAPAPAPAPAKEPSPPAGSEADPYGMPPPSQDQIRPRPEQRAPTPEEQKQTQQAATRLIENSILRLEFERGRAERAGDSETARRNQIRVERLRKRLALLKQEAAPSP